MSQPPHFREFTKCCETCKYFDQEEDFPYCKKYKYEMKYGGEYHICDAWEEG